MDFLLELLKTANVKVLCPNLHKLVRLAALHPAATASRERSFSLAKYAKNFLRSSMSDARMNHLCALKNHPSMLDDIDVETAMREFISFSEARIRLFGKNSVC